MAFQINLPRNILRHFIYRIEVKKIFELYYLPQISLFSCADAVYVRGLCLYREDNLEKALTHFQHVLRLEPDHARAKEGYKVRVLFVFFCGGM